MKLNIDLSSIQTTIQRFPVPIFCTLMVYILSFGSLDQVGFSLMLFSISVYVALGACLYSESRNWPSSLSFALSLFAVAVFCLLVMGLLTNKENASLVASLSASAILFTFIAPFISRRQSDAAFWLFSYRVWIRILQTIILSAVTFLGLAAILASLQYLFGISVPSGAYLKLWVFIALLLAPVFAMAGIPKTFDEDTIATTTLLKAQCATQAYAVIPLLLTYGLILHAYAGQIFFNGELPKGGVANLVTAFTCIGTIVYFMTYEIRDSYPALRFYVRHFSKVLLVPLILLGVSIFTRISDYGVTEQRYMLVIALIFFSTFVLLDLFTKKSKLRLTYATLIILLFISSAGPLSATSISLKSQQHRLKELLVKNHLIEGRTLVKAPQEVSFEDRKQISSILNYMMKKDRREKLGEWIEIKDANNILPLMKKMNIDDLPTNKEGNDHKAAFYHSTDANLALIKVSGFDYMIPFSAMENSSYQPNKKALDRQVFLASYSNNTKELHVFIKNGQRLDFDLSHIKQLPSNDTPLTFDTKKGNISARIIIKYINGSFDKDGLKIMNLGGNLLVKGKI